MKLLLSGNTVECNLVLKNEVLPIIIIQMITENSGYRKEAIFKMPVILWLHLREMSRISKPLGAESLLVIVQCLVGQER